MRLELLTLGGVAYQGSARSVSLATASGQITVLPHHEPLTSVVVPGPVSVTLEDGEVRHYAAFGGVLDVSDGQVRLLTDEAEPGEALVEAEIEAALAYAQELTTKAKTRHEVHQASEMAGRHAVRLQVAQMHRRRRERSGATPGSRA